MKKVLFWVLPLLVTACSLFSYQINKDYVQQIKNGNPNFVYQKITDQMQGFNRPKIQSPLNNKTVIIIKNGLDLSSFLDFSKNNFPNTFDKGIHGIILTEIINDPTRSLQYFLSGRNPSYSGMINNRNKDQIDDLILVAKQNKRKIVLLDNSSDEMQSQSFQQIISTWSQFDLLVFAFRDSTNLKDWTETFFTPISQNIKKEDQVLFCSLLPDKTTIAKNKLSHYFESPFFLYSDHINPLSEPKTVKCENFTATLAFSMGLSLPSDCMGFPELSFFSIPDPEKITRSTDLLDNFLMNSVKFLYQAGTSEEIIAGYLVESSDAIHLTEPKSVEEIQDRYKMLNHELSSFNQEARQRINIKISLLFLLVSLVFLLIWLILVLKFFRSFIFGAIYILIFIVFQYFIFRIPLSIPIENLISIRWYIFHFSIPFLLSSILLSAIYTIFSGYMFDIKIDEILVDMQGIVGTFGLFLVTEIAVLINLYGFHTFITSPNFFIISLLLRNFSLLILLPVSFALVYLAFFITYKLLMKYGPKPNS